jgi:hypothetical protein
VREGDAITYGGTRQFFPRHEGLCQRIGIPVNLRPRQQVGKLGYYLRLGLSK